MPLLANVLILLSIAVNGLSLVYLGTRWLPLTGVGLAVGLASLLLMWTVQCSDPGI